MLRTPAIFQERAAELQIVAEISVFRGVAGGAMNRLKNAVEKNDLLEVVGILNTGVSPDLSDPGDNSPLTIACDEGYFFLAKLLIDRGANVNYQSESGDSPLICAAVMGSEQLVALLIENGVDIDAKSRLGETACGYARHHGHNKVVELLTSHGAAGD